MTLSLRLLPMKDLTKFPEDDDSVIIGATDDIELSRTTLEKEYVGDMYYSRTTNKKTAEEQLLAAKAHKPHGNGLSKESTGHGFVYIIRGTRK